MKVNELMTSTPKPELQSNAVNQELWKRSMEAEQAAQWFLPTKRREFDLVASQSMDRMPSQQQMASDAVIARKVEALPSASSAPSEGSSCDDSRANRVQQHSVRAGDCTESEIPTAVSMAGSQSGNGDVVQSTNPAAVTETNDLAAFSSWVVTSAASMLHQAGRMEATSLRADAAQTLVTSLQQQIASQAPANKREAEELLDVPNLPVQLHQVGQEKLERSTGGHTPSVQWQGEQLHVQMPFAWMDSIDAIRLVTQIRSLLRAHGQDPSFISINHHLFPRQSTQPAVLSAQDRLHLMSV